GNITLISSGLLLTSSLWVGASGTNGGNGGTITITNQGAASGVEADIVVGGPTHFRFLATSGVRGGNGGMITLSTGRNIAIDVLHVSCPNGDCFNAGNLAGSGNGATYNLTAGTAMLGNLTIDTTDLPDPDLGLDASAGWNGNGGQINLTSNSGA